MSVCALDVISNVGAIDDLTSTARLIMILPVALLDGVFIMWVFTSLSATLRTLQFRNAVGKLQLYRRFTNALAVWVWVSVAWVAYEMYSKVSCAEVLLYVCQLLCISESSSPTLTILVQLAACNCHASVGCTLVTWIALTCRLSVAS